MANLYNGVCYENHILAAQAEQADPIKTTSDQLVYISDVAASSTANTAVLTITYQPTSTTAGSSLSINKTYPVCGTQPYDYTIGSSFGMSISDVIEVSFAVILVWLTAFAFRAMSRVTGVKL